MSISTVASGIQNTTINGAQSGLLYLTTTGGAPTTTVSGIPLIINDGTSNRLAAGMYSGVFKIKLSQAGNDVLTATDDHLIWSSDFNSFKIVGKFTGTVTGEPIGNGTFGLTITHNLGYKPLCWGTITISSVPYMLPFLVTYLSGAEPNFQSTLDQSARIGYVDNTTVVVNFTASDNNGGRSYFNNALVTIYAVRETVT